MSESLKGVKELEIRICCLLLSGGQPIFVKCSFVVSLHLEYWPFWLLAIC